MDEEPGQAKQYGPPHDHDEIELPGDDADLSPHDEKTHRIRGPPLARRAYAIPEFCAVFRISEDMFGKMQRDGWGPRTMRVGRRTLISIEAAEEWRREREAAAAQG